MICISSSWLSGSLSTLCTCVVIICYLLLNLIWEETRANGAVRYHLTILLGGGIEPAGAQRSGIGIKTPSFELAIYAADDDNRRGDQCVLAHRKNDSMKLWWNEVKSLTIKPIKASKKLKSPFDFKKKLYKLFFLCDFITYYCDNGLLI